jgi:hypothetical protein
MSLRFPCALVLVAGLAACTPGPGEESRGPSAGAARLLIEEADLGPQAQKLLANLKSDPYVYFRFVNRPWARATCKALGPVLAVHPHVHLHGDAHVGQYAYTRTQNGLDDLDDSISGPAGLDIVRFLGSVELATRARGWTDDRGDIVDEFFRGYRAALMDPGYRPPVPSYVSRMREQLAAMPVEQTEFLDWAESLMRPIEDVDAPGIEEGRRRLATLIEEERPELPAFYLEPKRIGWLRMGVGSALTPKLLLRTEGPTRADEDDFLLEARELSDLSQVSCVNTSESERAARIIEGYGRIGRISHDIVVVVPRAPEPVPGAREWWARSWEPSYRELQLDQLDSPRELAEIVHDAASQLGHGHAWTPEGHSGETLRERKREWLDRSEPRMRAVALQVTEDLLEAWEVFREPSPERRSN